MENVWWNERLRPAIAGGKGGGWDPRSARYGEVGAVRGGGERDGPAGRGETAARGECGRRARRPSQESGSCGGSEGGSEGGITNIEG